MPSKDYTKGKLNELIDIIIGSGAKLFVSAVGVPPTSVVDRLHNAGVLYMNMVGHPKHVQRCLDLGVDIICAQGGEGGGHTGDIPTTVLIPAVVKLVEGKTSPLTGKPLQVIAAGGFHNGQLLAAALMMGASAVWVGTRFVLTEEAGAPQAHKEAVRTAGFDDNTRTTIYTGRPMRVRKSPYILTWETERRGEMQELKSKGVVPVEADLEKLDLGDEDNADGEEALEKMRPYMMGACAAVVNEQKSAKEVVEEFVNDAVEWISEGSRMCAHL